MPKWASKRAGRLSKLPNVSVLSLGALCGLSVGATQNPKEGILWHEENLKTSI
jgi:hypothetical protein